MKTKIFSGYSVPVLLLVLIGVYSSKSILEFEDTASSVSKAHRIANLRESLMTDVVSAESEARGYIIMGKIEYLDLYTKALAEVRSSLDAIRSVRDDTAETGLIDRIIELVEMRLERLRISVETKQSDGLDAVVGRGGSGKRLMDELRVVSSELEHSNQKTTNEAAERLKNISERTTWVVGLGSSMAVLFHLIGTMALARANANRRRLERSLMEVSDREQRRIGQDLHDGVCQQLTGISLLARSLGKDLSPATAASLRQIVDLVNGCIEEARLVTKGLHPVPDEPRGLETGLRDMVETVNNTASLTCALRIEGELLVSNFSVSSNLYRIAQEAVRNAVRHAEATAIDVLVHADGEALSLQVTDNGKGIPAERKTRGLGLDIMRYRASTIGGSLQISSNHPSGTTIRFSSKGDL
jgi:signal transduction histidine kinase